MEESLNPTGALTCPHLGMKDDPDALYSYPSTGNLCHHCRRPESPLLAHQEAYCLTGAHEDCPVYLQAPTKAFLAELRAEEPRRLVRAAAIGRALAIGIVLAALGFGALRFFPNTFAGGLRVLQALSLMLLPSATPARAPSLTAMTLTCPSSCIAMPPPTCPASPVVTLTPPPTCPAGSVATPTLAPASATLSPAAAHALEVPIEVDGHELLLHRVGSGETFDTIDTKYQTTAEAIRSLNYSIGASLFVSSVIVIAPGLQTVDRTLPSFLTHRVGDAPALSIDQVAAQFNVAAELMRRYNGCTYDCELVASDWVLIPVLWP